VATNTKRYEEYHDHDRVAVAFRAKTPLEIVELDLEGPTAGEVLVEIMATGISIILNSIYSALGAGVGWTQVAGAFRGSI
jgi:hypothetical protein